MSKILDLTAKAKEIYKDNKAKGFWNDYADPKTRISQSVALIHSEITEMLEAHRRSDFVQIDSDTKLPERDHFKKWFEGQVKSSVEDEYADILIRTLDLAGALGIELKINLNIIAEYLDFYDFINHMHHLCNSIYNNQNDPEFSINTLVRTLFESQKFLGDISLYTHMDMKLEYNKLRPYKHGKNY